MLPLAIVVALFAPGATLNQSKPGDLCRAGARGGVQGALAADLDDRRPRPPIRFDIECQQNPLAKGCM
jgi:hypothetical protein